MDPLSHGLVGAAAAQLTGPRARNREVALAGFAAAVLADADVLLTRESDPLFQLELHRQFSHALLFIPIGAAVATALLWWLLRKRLALRALYVACFAGYATAGVLDACTSYGTQLLWPFSSARFAWGIVPVVDPILTLGLLLMVGLSVKSGKVAWARLALGWLGLTLLYGGIQQERAVRTARELQLSRGHDVETCVVKPTLGNQMLWRVNYQYGGRVYTDAIRTSWLSAPLVYVGESAPLVAVGRDFHGLRDTPVHRDLQRFSELSAGYLVRHPLLSDVVGDARYAMLPTSLSPLWGVQFNSAKPDQAVKFVTYRDSTPQMREAFLAMLLGRALASGQQSGPFTSGTSQ